jgi:Phosphoglycerate kinase
MFMLENARFEAGETRNDPALASAIAELADVYVNDAFAIAHCSDASTLGVARRLPCAAGPLIEREVHALSALLERPARPLLAILGGAKIGDRIGSVRRFLELATSFASAALRTAGPREPRLDRRECHGRVPGGPAITGPPGADARYARDHETRLARGSQCPQAGDFWL